MADRFFTAGPLAPGEFVLTGPDAHHLASVRRFAPGDRVTLFNGDGREYPAEVLAADRKHVSLNVMAAVEVDRELGFELVVASAVPKGDRADYLVEKLTELGTTRFVPLLTARSVVVPKSVDKFERAVIEASKQCGRNRLMRVGPPEKWDAFARRTDLPPAKLLLHTADAEPLPPLNRSGGVVFAVGPEGGFSLDEVAAGLAAGWRALSLGPRILRVETAAAAAVVWAQTYRCPS